MSDKPVIIELNVEYPGGSENETYEIDRAEWDAMTPAERDKNIDRAASDHAANYVGWGWYIADKDDAAAVNQT